LGNEFGATTGRPRRCGWIDLVALKFACMVNGVTKIIMTKADVLDSFKALQVCTAYLINGKETAEVPMNMGKLNIEPVYKKFTGWARTSSLAKTEHELPEAMSSYVEFINSYLGVKVHYISNGPGRDQLIEIG
jgi:adenylosuccinate synthase